MLSSGSIVVEADVESGHPAVVPNAEEVVTQVARAVDIDPRDLEVEVEGQETHRSQTPDPMQGPGDAWARSLQHGKGPKGPSDFS